MLSALTLVASETALASESAGHGEPAIHPYVIGAIALGILLGLLFALLAFAGGREHS